MWKLFLSVFYMVHSPNTMPLKLRTELLIPGPSSTIKHCSHQLEYPPSASKTLFEMGIYTLAGLTVTENRMFGHALANQVSGPHAHRWSSDRYIPADDCLRHFTVSTHSANHMGKKKCSTVYRCWKSTRLDFIFLGLTWRVPNRFGLKGDVMICWL